ncbi:hypothetical protein [Methanobrevibacter filiformis]|uniref:Uncharacterized protein n=1 Tax=Methanobrevibacter filiformis TaxID=55758 RepID=A0A166F697_9EURY|nr:hypothetical protein [Methanobrevibacter filiformis]KZX17358.1 hypothetical protein MBFIL_02000 [Methanobrevibacter filiformis]
MKYDLPKYFTDEINSYLEVNNFFESRELKNKLNNKEYQKTLKKAKDYLKKYDAKNKEYSYYKIHHDKSFIENIAKNNDLNENNELIYLIIENLKEELKWPPLNSYLLYSILFFSQLNKIFESFFNSYENLINNVLEIDETEENSPEKHNINEDIDNLEDFVRFSNEFIVSLERYYKIFMKDILNQLDINVKIITILILSIKHTKDNKIDFLDNLLSLIKYLANIIEDSREMIITLRKLNKPLEKVKNREIIIQYDKTRKIINK